VVTAVAATQIIAVAVGAINPTGCCIGSGRQHHHPLHPLQ